MNQKQHEAGHEQDLDEPTPPDGPLRTDAPSAGGTNTGTPAQDPGPQVHRVTEREDAGDPPPPTHDPDREQSPALEAQQEANAEASDYGQPSQ